MGILRAMGIFRQSSCPVLSILADEEVVRVLAACKPDRLPVLPLISVGGTMSRVENRRSGFSLPVAADESFRVVASVRFGLALFPVLAHRTGQADFPHPALGKDTRSSV